jgi:hypothetical protein
MFTEDNIAGLQYRYKILVEIFSIHEDYFYSGRVMVIWYLIILH